MLKKLYYIFLSRANIGRILMILCGLFLYLGIFQGEKATLFISGDIASTYSFYTYNNKVITARYDEYAEVKNCIKNIRGESVNFAGGTEDVLSFLTRSKAKIIFCEEEAGITILYCFDKNLNDSIVVDGERINLHIAINKGRVTIGYPFIFGSF